MYIYILRTYFVWQKKGKWNFTRNEILKSKIVLEKTVEQLVSIWGNKLRLSQYSHFLLKCWQCNLGKFIITSQLMLLPTVIIRKARLEKGKDGKESKAGQNCSFPELHSIEERLVSAAPEILWHSPWPSITHQKHARQLMHLQFCHWAKQNYKSQ